MANATASPNRQALPTFPSPAQTLPVDAVFDALNLIEAQTEGAVCSLPTA